MYRTLTEALHLRVAANRSGGMRSKNSPLIAFLRAWV